MDRRGTKNGPGQGSLVTTEDSPVSTVSVLRLPLTSLVRRPKEQARFGLVSGVPDGMAPPPGGRVPEAPLLSDSTELLGTRYPLRWAGLSVPPYLAVWGLLGNHPSHTEDERQFPYRGALPPQNPPKHGGFDGIERQREFLFTTHSPVEHASTSALFAGADGRFRKCVRFRVP